jgi:predicted transposase/invertase (TIGR01784 family)
MLVNPHDKFFKESFSRKEVAQSFLQEYLPSAVGKKLDLEQLEILKDSFIDKELDEHFSDMLYGVPLGGHRAYVYLLFEHKSYNDPWVGFQLLRSMVKIWELYRRHHPRARKLPIIIPLLLYHGKQPCGYPNSLKPLFIEFPEAAVYIPDFRTVVVDISHLPDDAIRGQIMEQACLLLFKYALSPQLFDKLGGVLQLLQQLSNKSTALEYIEVVLRYLTASVDSARMDDLKQLVVKAIEEGGDIMPTIAEKWILEGKQKGFTDVAQKLIEKGLSDEDIRDITGLSIQKIQSLRQELK